MDMVANLSRSSRRPSASRLAWIALLLIAGPALGAVRQTTGLVNRGTPWETPYYIQQSDVPGPTVVIVGGVHGDEPAGAAAAEEIRHWPILRGTLAVLPRANPPALAANSRNMPGVDKEQGNLNRNFPKAGQGGPPAGQAAQGIWNWLQAQKPDWVLDLHEGTGIRKAGSKSVGSSIIVFPSPEAEAATKQMLEAVNATIDKEAKKFVRLGMPVDGSLARAAGEHLSARAMTVETSIGDLPPEKKSGQAAASASSTSSPSVFQPRSLRQRQHRLMVHTLLVQLKIIDPQLPVHALFGRRGEADPARVAVYDAGGTGGSGALNVDRILSRANMQVRRVGPDELAAGALDQFDLLVVPGGSGSKEAAAIGQQGREQVKRFVENGGGYMGICAGAYLCTSGFTWGLGILDAKTVSQRWARGKGEVQIELTPAGRKLLGDRPGRLDVRYANGPIITRAGVDDLPDYEVLAWFRTELAENGAPAGIMVDSPAMAAGRCGKGRVMFISPHPEGTNGLEDLVERAARWAADKTSP